jgi:hypothetical protein
MKRKPDGTTSQIGGPTHSVRDFLVYPDGWVLFHGSDASNWSIEWLRIYVGSTVHNIFYNDQTQGSYGYMRSYFLDKNRNVILAVSNITFENPSGSDEIKCSGIVRVPLDANGKPTKFPLVLETGVTEASIDEYIRKKYQAITMDNLGNLIFSGLTFEGVNEWDHNTIIGKFEEKINLYIQGTTWVDFRKTNELEGVQFGSAKQILPMDDGSVIAAMKLDNWGSSGALKGDKLFSIMNSKGEASIFSYQRDSSYKTINKALAWRNYIFCLVLRAGKSKILRYEANNPTAQPLDMTPNLSNVEISSLNIDSDTGKLTCGLYDYSTNSASMIELTPEGEISEVSTKSFTILDVLPFKVSP